METLAFFANLGSLVGLAATLWTTWRAFRSKRYYQLVGRVPAGIETLQQGTSLLSTANDEQEQRFAMGQIKVGAESIARNIGRSERKDFDRLARRIRQTEEDDSLPDREAEAVYIKAETLASQAEALVNDRKFLRAS